MRRTLTLATAALTLAGAFAVGGPAAAQYRRDRDRNGDAVAAGVLGFALGAAVGSSGSRYNGGYYAPSYGGGYYAPSYGRGYYAPGYGQRYYGRAPAYAYGYQYRRPQRCVVDRQWDPRWGRSVEVRRCW